MINPSEELDIVDSHDNVIRTLPRKQVHEQMALHRVSLIWVMNSENQVLCQKRSPQKDRWAGMWECWFGGHVLTGQSYLDTAVAETREELGIVVATGELKLFDKRTAQTSEENLYLSIYLLKKNLNVSQIAYEKEEVELLEWISIQRLKEIYAENNSEWVVYGYEHEMLNWLS